MGLGRSIQQPARGRRLMAPADIHRERSSALGISELQQSRQTDAQRHTDKLQEFRELSWHTDRQPPRQRLLRAACVSPHSLPGRLHLARNNASLSTQPHRNPQRSQVKRCAGSPCPTAAREEASLHHPCMGMSSQLQQPRWGKEQRMWNSSTKKLRWLGYSQYTQPAMHRSAC